MRGNLNITKKRKEKKNIKGDPPIIVFILRSFGFFQLVLSV